MHQIDFSKFSNDIINFYGTHIDINNNINIKNNEGMTLLVYSVKNNKIDLFNTLMTHPKICIHSLDIHNNDALLYALSNHCNIHIHVIKKLLEHPTMDINTKVYYDATDGEPKPIIFKMYAHALVDEQFFEIYEKILKDLMTNINICTTFLYDLAYGFREVSLFEYMCSFTSRVNKIYGDKGVHMIKILLERTDIILNNDMLRCVISCSKEISSFEILAMFIDRTNIDVTKLYPKKKTLLNRILSFNFRFCDEDICFVMDLIDVCEDNINHKDSDGMSYLYLASKNGHSEIVQYLLSKSNIIVDI